MASPDESSTLLPNIDEASLWARDDADERESGTGERERGTPLAPDRSAPAAAAESCRTERNGCRLERVSHRARTAGVP